MARINLKRRAKDKVYSHYKRICQYCFEKEATTLDHIIPLSQGGSKGVSNLVPACKDCNEKKAANLLPEEILIRVKGRAISLWSFRAGRRRGSRRKRHF
jgi:5-methylcytosine-specific restriction endonuclease McrA